ncbi:hypothetical protein H5410_060992 [Solanum commersonii]|uniref:Uncharacterized protein n=1 Tax=Solanum commersonii TaxID=4109 RepID=A0A9J5W6R1_SOLCO|nr:hypothetical protein H5410_060992 [Solanum commersonii]
MIANTIKPQYVWEPVEVSALKKITITSKVCDFSNEKNDDAWILVTRKRKCIKGLLNSDFQNSEQNQVQISFNNAEA